jgi:hypothetical protein
MRSGRAGYSCGAFSRTILQVLREAEEPMGIRDIAAALKKKSGKDLDGHEFDLVVARCRGWVSILSGKRGDGRRFGVERKPPLVSPKRASWADSAPILI